MIRTFSPTPKAQIAYELVSRLQHYFVNRLEHLSQIPFEGIEWFRDEGRHGGGLRYEARDPLFNRASVNVSQIHYTDMPQKALDSASAISTIIHPQNPHAPSMHMHISWTQTKEGKGYWRMMADLNPAIVYEEDSEQFSKMLQEAAPTHYEEASAQGDRYFFIPVLNRHRGVSHFYLENFHSGDEKADIALAGHLGEKVIDTYIRILEKALRNRVEILPEDQEKQLAYHTLYLFQVLTLDRGTTSGLLIHDQNDIGILGSLPSHVDKTLLRSWIKEMPKPQEELLQNIVDVLPLEGSMIDETVKKVLAQSVRNHYQHHPEALHLQASGNSIPPTVQNHL